MILLDTHALIWLDAGSSKLGNSALLLLNEALQKDELVVSAISFWEIAMLVEKGRLKISKALAVWRKELLYNGLQEVPLSGNVAIQAGRLRHFRRPGRGRTHRSAPTGRKTRHRHP